MSDLLSPFVAVMEDEAAAFWCFVGFMQKRVRLGVEVGFWGRAVAAEVWGGSVLDRPA